MAGLPVLYLHIGLYKAGSSAIQRTLAAEERTLRRHGLLYPRTGRARSQAHHLLSHVLGFSMGTPPRVQRARDLEDLGPKLAAEARRARVRAVVLSSEAFSARGEAAIARVREFLAGWDVRVVVYLRRHDHWWASCYSQGVKMMRSPPWDLGFESYLAFHRRRGNRGNYRRLLEDWAGVFGAGNLIVRPYEREQNQPSIVADLLGAIGFPELAERVGTRVPRYNESLGARELAVVDALHHAGLDDALRRRIVRAVIAGPQGPRGAVMAPALAREIVEEQLEEYAWIARTWLGRADGRLFLEPLPDPSAPWTAPEPASLAEIVAAVTRAADASRGSRWRLPWMR